MTIKSKLLGLVSTGLLVSSPVLAVDLVGVQPAEAGGTAVVARAHSSTLNSKATVLPVDASMPGCAGSRTSTSTERDPSRPTPIAPP